MRANLNIYSGVVARIDFTMKNSWTRYKILITVSLILSTKKLMALLLWIALEENQLNPFECVMGGR